MHSNMRKSFGLAPGISGREIPYTQDYSTVGCAARHSTIQLPIPLFLQAARAIFIKSYFIISLKSVMNLFFCSIRAASRYS